MKFGQSGEVSPCFLKTVSDTPLQEDAGVLLLQASGVVGLDQHPSSLAVCRPVSAACQNQHAPPRHTGCYLCMLQIICHC